MSVSSPGARNETVEGVDYEEAIRSDLAVATALAGRPILLLGRFGGDGTYPVGGELEDSELARVTIEFGSPDDASQ